MNLYKLYFICDDKRWYLLDNVIDKKCFRKMFNLSKCVSNKCYYRYKIFCFF